MPFVCAKAPPALLLGSTCEPHRDASSVDTLSWRLGVRSNGGFSSPFASLSSSSAHAALGLPQPPSLASPPQVHLPFGVKKGTTTLRYVWDSNAGIQALDAETLRNGKDDGGSYFRHLILSLQDRLHKAFIPNKEEVTDDYWEWLKWRLTQRLFSSTLQNLSTQSMLIALGLGAKRTIAASAAINWLLKDGVGRIARMTVATSFCQSFDSDLKRIRYVTSLIFDTTIACEFLTPFFPQYFLPLASLANVGKAVALAAFVAVQPAFQRAMCAGGNLADITAKNQAQHMMVDMVALGISAVAMYTVRNSERGRILVPLLAYPMLASLDLWAIYNELKAVELKVCNKERAEMVAEKWLLSGKMPGASEVSQEERLLFPPDISGGLLPLHITSIHRVMSSLQEAQALSRQYKDEQYMMALHFPAPRSASVPEVAERSCDRGLLGQLLGRKQPQPELRVTLSDKAVAADIFKAVLHAAYLRQMLKTKLLDKLAQYHARAQGGKAACSVAAPEPAHRSAAREDGLRGDELWTTAGVLISPSELEACMTQAKLKAQKGLGRFLQELQAQGWRTKTVLLSTTEKFKYIKLAADKK